MFRPQIQKTRVLFSLAMLIMAMVYWAVNSYEQHETYGFDLKVKAVENMENAINSLREAFIALKINNGEDSLAFGSFLLGPQNSIIQITKGLKNSKLSTLNPNFAAMIMEMFIELELDSSSKIAISYTGSYPGANIAVLSVLETMEMDASIISSCDSYSYGATYPEMTWIDMESYLYKEDHVSNKSKSGSIGGSFDSGSQLNPEGRDVCNTTFSRNNIEQLEADTPGELYEYYTDSTKDVSLFINVGGGINAGGSVRDVGIIRPSENFNSSLDSTVIERFLEDKIPVININNIKKLTYRYELPYPPNNKSQIKTGDLFYSREDYNIKVILLAFIIVAGTVLFVGIVSHREIKKRMHSSEPESIL